MDNNLIFSETQTASQNKIIYLLYFSLSVIVISFIYLLVSNQLDAVWTIFMIIIVSIIIMVINSRFTLSVTKKEFSFSYFPFILNNRKIFIDEIKSISINTYDPISEFGGWGIRKSNNKRLYSMSGNSAIIVEKKDGDIYYFGTKESNNFAEKIKLLINN